MGYWGVRVMQQVIDLIPFLDVIITALLVLFMYAGWKQGFPRMVMVAGALYTGFLLASIYYHLFAVMLGNLLKVRPDFTTELMAFIIVNAVSSGLMLALLINLFGHIEIGGRAVVFNKIAGLTTGLLAGAFTVGIMVALLRAPVIANETKQNDTVNLPAVVVFSNSYDRSLLGPNLMKIAPVMLRSVAPLLPTDIKEQGAVPLLQSVVATK